MNDKQKFYELRDKLKEHKYEVEHLIYNFRDTFNMYSGIVHSSKYKCAEYSLFEELEKVNNIVVEIGNIVEYAISELYEVSSPPLVIHQDISQLISNNIFQFCLENRLHYRILSAPIKVVLTENNKYYEPDIIVVLDSKKIKRDGCYGAPDVIFEIISKSTKKTDYEEKQSIYLENGVNEYFIVDPVKQSTFICHKKREITEKKFSEDFMIESIPGLIINIHNSLLSYLF